MTISLQWAALKGSDLQDFHVGVAQRHYVADLFAH
jgi:hypothetical protein